MNQKLTDNIIDQMLNIYNRPIKRIGSYINSQSKIDWQCLVENCRHIWFAIPRNILKLNNNTGCPKCINKARLTNYIVDQKLIINNRPIKRIGNYINSSTKIDWQCLKISCTYIWPSTPTNILYRNSGCPKCAGKAPLTNYIIDKILKENNRPIKRIGDYINSYTNADWQCLDCNYIWFALSKNILYKKTNCPRCSNYLPLTKKIVIEKLNKVNIELIEDYIVGIDNSHSNKKCKCKKCNHGENGDWTPVLSGLLNNNKGCPKCHLPRNERIMLSLLKETLDNNILSNYCLNKINKSARLKLRFDAYSSIYNIAFEYDGLQHFEPIKFSNKISNEQALVDLKKRQINDEYKNNFCKENNIKLIRIDGRKYKNDSLKSHLNEIIKSISDENNMIFKGQN